MASPSIFSAVKKLRALLERHEKVQWLWIVFFALSTSVLETVTASVIIIFAQVLNHPPEGAKYMGMIGLSADYSEGIIVQSFSILVAIVFIVKNIVAGFEVFFQNFTIQKMNYTFKNKLLNSYSNMDYSVYLTRNSSFGIQMVSGDVERVFAYGMISMAGIISEATVFVFLLGMVVFLDPSMAFSIFLLGIVMSLCVWKWLLPQFYLFGQKLQYSSLHCGQNLIQFFHSFKEIVLLGKTSFFIDIYQRYSLEKSRVQAIHASVNAMPRIVLEVIFVLVFVLVIIILCFEQESFNHMIGLLGGYLYAGFRLMPGINRIVNHLNVFKSTVSSIESVYEEYVAMRLQKSIVDTPQFSFKECISVKNISFKYRGSKKNALSDVCLTIKKGESIGIVGKTGSGKSTLVDAILGLLRPYKGRILIDNKFPVNSYQWHKRIGYVPQMIYLIDDSIEKNIAFGEDVIDSAKLNASIDAAQLRDFVNSLPESEKTLVGERGVRLSGGERQRIAIARALYHDPEVLIFDEATSALDSETEGCLIATISDLSKNRTVIMIAHRLSTLQNCNRIIKVERGRLYE